MFAAQLFFFLLYTPQYFYFPLITAHIFIKTLFFNPKIGRYGAIFLLLKIENTKDIQCLLGCSVTIIFEQINPFSWLCILQKNNVSERCGDVTAYWL